MRFPFFRNRDSVKNGILISIRRTGDGFHPGLFTLAIDNPLEYARLYLDSEMQDWVNAMNMEWYST